MITQNLQSLPTYPPSLHQPNIAAGPIQPNLNEPKGLPFEVFQIKDLWLGAAQALLHITFACHIQQTNTTKIAVQTINKNLCICTGWTVCNCFWMGQWHGKVWFYYTIWRRDGKKFTYNRCTRITIVNNGHQINLLAIGGHIKMPWFDSSTTSIDGSKPVKTQRAHQLFRPNA